MHIPLQMLLPEGRVILVGDPQQLPATVISRSAEQAGLARSLFERLQEVGFMSRPPPLYVESLPCKAPCACSSVRLPLYKDIKYACAGRLCCVSATGAIPHAPGH